MSWVFSDSGPIYCSGEAAFICGHLWLCALPLAAGARPASRVARTNVRRRYRVSSVLGFARRLRATRDHATRDTSRRAPRRDQTRRAPPPVAGTQSGQTLTDGSIEARRELAQL